MSDNIRILFVDDEANVLRALERVFLDEDYELLKASSGEEGLEILRAVSPVHVIISDYRMPGMSGVDFLREVREQWPETVRIVLSGYADTAAVVSAINEGQIYKFLPKPWNPDELRVTVENALERFFLNRKNKELSQELQAKNEELRILKLSLERIVMEKTEEILLQNRLLSRSQAILDHAPVGVLTADPNGIIVQCNVEAGRILSCGGSEGVFTTPGAVVPEELASCINTSYRDPRTIGEFFIGGMAVQVTVCRFEEEENAKTILALTPTCDGGRD